MRQENGGSAAAAIRWPSRWTLSAFDANVLDRPMIAIQILIGLFVLFYGRQLFWLFVGAVGFMLATTFVGPLLIGRPEWQVLTIALIAGMMGALCAFAVERIAITVAGFLAGGAIAMRVLHLAAFDAGQFVWLVVLAGSVLGAAVVNMVFDWALIGLSSAVGAALVTEGIGPRTVDPRILFAVLLVVGIVAQTRRRRFHPAARARR